MHVSRKIDRANGTEQLMIAYFGCESLAPHPNLIFRLKADDFGRVRPTTAASTTAFLKLFIQ